MSVLKQDELFKQPALLSLTKKPPVGGKRKPQRINLYAIEVIFYYLPYREKEYIWKQNQSQVIFALQNKAFFPIPYKPYIAWF